MPKGNRTKRLKAARLTAASFNNKPTEWTPKQMKCGVWEFPPPSDENLDHFVKYPLQSWYKEAEHEDKICCCYY